MFSDACLGDFLVFLWRLRSSQPSHWLLLHLLRRKSMSSGDKDFLRYPLVLAFLYGFFNGSFGFIWFFIWFILLF